MLNIIVSVSRCLQKLSNSNNTAVIGHRRVQNEENLFLFIVFSNEVTL